LSDAIRWRELQWILNVFHRRSPLGSSERSGAQRSQLVRVDFVERDGRGLAALRPRGHTALRPRRPTAAQPHSRKAEGPRGQGGWRSSIASLLHSSTARAVGGICNLESAIWNRARARARARAEAGGGAARPHSLKALRPHSPMARVGWGNFQLSTFNFQLDPGGGGWHNGRRPIPGRRVTGPAGVMLSGR
jgi:hypothetical protein